MNIKHSRTLVAITVLLALLYLSPRAFSQGYSYSYQLLNSPGGSTYYRLNVDVSQSLYEYYLGKTHALNSETDFAKFVTPYALKPIADNLWRIYTDDEDFANGALMIVHQIPYEVTAPSKYPVETIVDNKGDCDLLSYVAASIMAAGGLDVVLFYYESEAHLNIGVSLSHAPYDARESAFYVTYNSVRYYMAEATGGDWEDGWRVGESPDSLKQASVQVVTLENSEQSSAGQVSASYKTLVASTLSLVASSPFVVQGSTITLSGQLSPHLQNVAITIYFRVENSQWIVLGTVTTDADGRFAYAWNGENAGIVYTRASWSGNDDYSSADSPIQTVTVLSTFFLVLLGLMAVLVFAGLAVFVASKRTQPQMLEPQPPEVPQ